MEHGRCGCVPIGEGERQSMSIRAVASCEPHAGQAGHINRIAFLRGENDGGRERKREKKRGRETRKKEECGSTRSADPPMPFFQPQPLYLVLLLIRQQSL